MLIILNSQFSNLKSRQKREGFTLIELLVVVSLIGILMGIMLVSYQGTRKSARDGRRMADLEQIRAALEIYRVDCGLYPDSLTFIPPGNTLVGPAGSPSCAGNIYLSKVPQDPLNNLADPNSYTYKYRLDPADPNKYNLCAFLEEAGGVDLTDCGGYCFITPEGENVACNYKVSNP